MKKSIWISILIVLLLFCMCGCTNTDNEKSQSNATKTDIGENDLNNYSPEVQHKEIAYELTTTADYNKLASNFSDLVKDADLILKIRVESVKSFINNNGMIQTEITPTVQEVYKGLYNNEKLYVNGGEMLYDEFIQNEVIKKAVSGHESPNDEQYKGKYVRQLVDNQYIFNCGDEYIFFAKKRVDSGKYYSLYAYQGTFKVNNGLVENIALNNDEPLKIDITNTFNMSSKTSNLESSGNTISEGVFAEKIKNLK